MSDTPTWTIDTLTIAGDETTDALGRTWVVNSGGEKGWITSTAPRTARTVRPSGPGSFRSVAWRNERIITLAGSVQCPTPAIREQTEMQLATLCSDPATLYTLRRTTDTADLTAGVELDAAPLVDMVTAYRLDWSLQFAAPDPRRHAYTWQAPTCLLPSAGAGAADFTAPGLDFTAPGVDFGTAPVAGSATVTNTGTAPAHPLFIISDACPQPVITEVATGNALTYSGALASGDVLTINTDDFAAQGVPGHGVILNGTRNQRALLQIAGSWPVVAPGTSQTYTFNAAAGGPAVLTVQLRSAWN